MYTTIQAALTGIFSLLASALWQAMERLGRGGVTCAILGSLSPIKWFTPIQELPVELLHHIFLLACVPCQRHSRPLECMRARCEGGGTSSLVLGRVCRDWRNVAWGLPDLWQRLDIIVTKTDHEDGFSRKVQLIKEWIQRAQGRLLTISVQPPGKTYGGHSPHPIFDCCHCSPAHGQ